MNNSFVQLASALTIMPAAQVMPPPTGALPVGADVRSVPAQPKSEGSADTRASARAWINDFRTALVPLRALKAGWDGPRSRPVEPALFYTVEHLLGASLASVRDPILPFAVPTAAGGLQIEWHRPHVEVEVMFAPDGQITALVEDLVSGREFEAVDVEALGLLARWAPRAAQARPDARHVSVPAPAPRFELAA